MRRYSIVALTALLAFGVSADRLLAQHDAADTCDVSTLGRLKVTGLSILAARRVAAGSFTPAGSQSAMSELPAFCHVQARLERSSASLINVDVWIPGRWNGKLVMTGNGGYSNVPGWRDMGYALSQGYAAVGTDTGHQTATPDDLLWGVDHPDRIIDWAGRAMHAALAPSRRIAEAVGGERPSRAYFYGCSTGGHQAYAAIQRYPEDFDGVIAGAPGNNRVRLNAGFLWQFLANHTRGDAEPIVPASKLPAITKAVIAACDANDGVADGVVDDPRMCEWKPSAMQCAGGDEPGCLTAPQVQAVEKMYAGARNARTGAQVYPGWPRSSEGLTSTPQGGPASGWHLYWGSSEPTRANFWRHWVFSNPKWDWWTFDFDRDIARADATAGRLVDHVDPDISRFGSRGRKAIVYQGWQDPVVNALDTIAYYEKVRAGLGSQQAADRFFRLFLVPGLGHCSGGTGTTAFGNQGGAAPIVDADHDLLSALDAWVEKGAAPDRIIASRVVNGATVRTRPLCPYPKKAVYSGIGSTDDAASFACR